MTSTTTPQRLRPRRRVLPFQPEAMTPGRRDSYCGHLSPNTYENQLAATIPEAT
jgi:hypothetical protein